MESSRVAKAAQEPKVNTEEGVRDFDLNREVCFDEMNHPMNSIPNYVIVVSASSATAPPRLPLGPLQFAGARGFTGPSATSAFCPVIPRRFLKSDKTLVGGGTRNIPQQRWQDFLDFDLNKAYSTEDEIANLIPGKQILVSEKSSVEVAPRRSDGLMLDLNRRSDEDAAPFDCNIEGLSFHHKDNQRRPSLFSSSSSMLRKIDDKQPSFFNDSANLQLYFGKSSSSLNPNDSEGIKLGNSVISILGTKVEVNRNHFVPQTPSLPNKKILEPSPDCNLARCGGLEGMGSTNPWALPPVFGYNPYIVDSRGAPVLPQILGSTSASRPPFVMGVIETHPDSNGTGPSRPKCDMNSGFMFAGENRYSGVVRPFSDSSKVRLMGEHLRVNSQPASDSGRVGKRKGPESGWEPYPSKDRHQAPWK